MEKKVPSKVLVIEEELENGEVLKHEVEVYKWFTQDEDDIYTNLQVGDQTIDTDSEKQKFTVSFTKVIEARNYKMKTLIKSPSWEEISTWEPSLRDKVIKELDELTNKKKS